jgi:thiamine biosynthesis lipoprotein
VGFRKVALDVDGRRVRKPPGLQVDLSSMTHGYGAEQVAQYLNEVGVTSYLIDVGSEIRAQGASPEGGAWRVAVERPPPEDSSTKIAFTTATSESPLHIVFLRNAGIATSGNYRYYFDYSGRRYSHRIDPRTGEPVKHSLAAVTVIDADCSHADALATALTVLGPDEGLDYATDRNIAALFILRDGEKLVERMTPRFANYLH